MAGRVTSDFDSFIAQVMQVGGRIRRAVNEALREEALGVQELARRYVPVDTDPETGAPYEPGYMERAIKVASADFRRRWIVYVDEDSPDDTGRYTVGAYLRFLHEGSYRLGPGSIAKGGYAAGVGPKFLERAWAERVASGMLRRIENEARKAGVL